MSSSGSAATIEAPAAPGRECYRDIRLYAPDRSPCPTDLSDNTNLWGVPPRALQVLGEAAGSVITRYPALYAHRLKEALSAYTGLPEEMIVTGCGSDDVLDSTFRAFGEEGDVVAYPDPSFPMIPLFASMNALRCTTFGLDSRFDVDPDEVLATAARIIYLCWPNNPTGTLMSKSALEEIVANAPGVVVLDEAYAEFAGCHNQELLELGERLVIVRTMSKAFGMAGLRIGYALAHPRSALEIEKSRGPYKISALAELAGVTALTEDMEWVRSTVDEAKENRDRFAAEASSLPGYEPIPSSANFVMLRITGGGLPGAVGVASIMRERGVAVRPFANSRGLGDCIRVSVGPWQLMQRCLEALPRVS